MEYQVTIAVSLPSVVPTGRWAGKEVTRPEVDAMVAGIVDEFGAPADLEEMGIVVSVGITERTDSRP